MPSFADSFWSLDYSSGLDVLFDKLNQGCDENDEVLAMAHARAEAEAAFGAKLQEIPQLVQTKKSGFARDDGASLKKAYEEIVKEMSKEGACHLQVAANIRQMVSTPFGKWADDHRLRVNYSYKTLKSKQKKYNKELNEVQKAQKKYFNKCRLLDDYDNSIEAEDEDKNEKENTEAKNENIDDSDTIPKSSSITNLAQTHAASISQKASELFSRAATPATTEKGGSSSTSIIPAREPIDMAGELYEPEAFAEVLRQMLMEIPRKSIKVSFLGTYEDVSTGDSIVEWILTRLPHTNTEELSPIAFAERFGQDMILNGYLRLVANVGNKFANSSVLTYQWRKPAFLEAGFTTNAAITSGDIMPFSNQAEAAVAAALTSQKSTTSMGEYLTNYITPKVHDESPRQRLQREVDEVNEKYKEQVLILDDTRCTLEETIVDHLKFMERCESDRLKAIKSVFLDFSAALANSIPHLQVLVDNLLLYQETIHPANDLRYMLESYRTGSFIPKVTIYDNYYNSCEDQTFGIDLELRSKSDHKKVPMIISTLLSHLDDVYPLLDNDQVRRNVWVVSVSLQSTHNLRREINTGKTFSKKILRRYEAPIVANVLKLYLLELPDSLVPSNYYDVIKTIYAQYGNDSDALNRRIPAISNIFAQFRLSSIATLDAICTHLTRIIQLIGAPETYAVQLAQELSLCILRPREQSALTVGENRHSYRLMLDLLTYKDHIFSELKRKNSALRNVPMPVSIFSTPTTPTTPTTTKSVGSVSSVVTTPTAVTAVEEGLRSPTKQLNQQRGVRAPMMTNHSYNRQSWSSIQPSQPPSLVASTVDLSLSLSSSAKDLVDDLNYELSHLGVSSSLSSSSSRFDPGRESPASTPTATPTATPTVQNRYGMIMTPSTMENSHHEVVGNTSIVSVDEGPSSKSLDLTYQALCGNEDMVNTNNNHHYQPAATETVTLSDDDDDDEHEVIRAQQINHDKMIHKGVVEIGEDEIQGYEDIELVDNYSPGESDKSSGDYGFSYSYDFDDDECVDLEVVDVGGPGPGPVGQQVRRGGDSGDHYEDGTESNPTVFD